MEITSEQEEVSILLLGDAEVGKSTFLSRLSALKEGPSIKRLPVLRDSEQPFVFDVTMYRKSFRLEFYDTASPTSYLLQRPSIIILCFSIVDRKSLFSLHSTWKDVVEANFNLNEQIPVLVLGLKRDLRREHDSESIYPHEAVSIAQAMRCDRYCECSALTGELCDLVFEDIAKTAAATTTEEGGRSQGPACSVM
ncbi:P-loop containing nucleoside triphosphate hydrolase protein [Elsinoe ampelina]|uniref:P-loop containing nucleoside triphosphate hydrolase protein n=1 Tax=Elsinoe ampelina TaxID=302913 RepID=A0A6A6GNQ5_9PEZI|nr:P-loop containing nucleoside triphosphate hydrolase protein [Elsinoe ampelina]